MKTVLEQLMEVNEKLAAIEKLVYGDNSDEFTPCCTTTECGCGCDEPLVEVEDNGPEYDGAGFSEADREPEPEPEPESEPEPEPVIIFTKEELITLAAKLMERAIKAAKEAVSDTNLDADDLVSLELNTWNGNAIEIELDKDAIVDSICSEISDTIYLDNDSVEDELHDILVEIGKIS